MKTKNITHATTASLLLMSLTLGACGKNMTTREVVMMPGTTSSQIANMQTSELSGHESWRRLILSNEKNIALAEILSATVAKENQAMVQELVSSLTTEEIKEIITQVKSEREVLRKSFLFRQNTQLEGTDLYRRSILEEDYKVADSEINQMTIATFSYLKSKSMEEIYKSFNTVIAENSKDIAQAMIQDIGTQNVSLAKELEVAVSESANAEEFSSKLAKSQSYLEKADEYFKYSGLNTKEQLMMIATGAVGAVIFAELKSTKTFGVLLKKYKDIQVVIKDVKEKIELVKMTVEIIKRDRDLVKASIKDLNSGLAGVKEGIQESIDQVKNSPDADSKKTAQFLYDKVIKGKELNKAEANASILASQKKISENLSKSFVAAGNMANNLESIVLVTQKLSSDFGIKLPAGLQKALATASKVAAGVKLASALVSGFMSGGVLTAVGALSSGPLGSMLGMGGGTDPQVMAALGRIEAKLDVVLENQQKMMEMQIETIKMIKNLAIMVDEYHQKEMIALAGLHDDNMINQELSKAKLNANIRRCESLIDLELKKFWGKDSRNAFNGSVTTELDYSKFYSNFKTLNDFRKFARGATANDYAYCQDALSEAFGNTSTIDNPILSIFNSEDHENLFAFQRDTYKPLVGLLALTTENLGERKKVLHIPMSRVSDLDLKSTLLNSHDSLVTNNEFDYNFDSLLSTKSLERYFSSYAILYPVFEFDKSDWDKSLPELVETYYKNMSPTDGTSIEEKRDDNISRSYFFMSNALDFIQSAIAQEALLAGESLIPTIKAKYGASVLKDNGCETALICAIRSNKLLMQNYLAYTIQKNITFVNTLEKYKAEMSSANPNLAVLSEYLNLKGAHANVLTLENQVVTISLKALSGKVTKIPLPKAEIILEDRMLYSENMTRLLKMQKSAIAALVKLSPSQFRSVEDRVGLANLLLVKEF